MNSFDCKFDKLGEVDEFLERQILTTLLSNLTSLKSIKKTKIVVKNLPTKKTLGLHGFTVDYYQLSLFQKIGKERISYNLFFEVCISLMQNQAKYYKKRKLHTSTPH